MPGAPSDAFAQDAEQHDAAHGERRPHRQVDERAQGTARALRQEEIERTGEGRVDQEQQGGDHDRPARAFVRIEHTPHVAHAHVVERRLSVWQSDGGRALPGVAHQIHQLEPQPRIARAQLGVRIEGQEVHLAQAVARGLAPGRDAQIRAAQAEERGHQLVRGLGRLEHDVRGAAPEFAGRFDRHRELAGVGEAARCGRALHVSASQGFQPRAVQVFGAIEDDRQRAAREHPRKERIERPRRQARQRAPRSEHHGRARVARRQVRQDGIAGRDVDLGRGHAQRGAAKHVAQAATADRYRSGAQGRRDAARRAQIEEQRVELAQRWNRCCRQLLTLGIDRDHLGFARMADQAMAR